MMLAIIVIWLAVGHWLMLTGRAGYDLTGSAPAYIHILAYVSTVLLAPGMYLYVLIIGKDIG